MLCQGGWDAPIDLMPPTEPNQKGFWESLGLYLINDNFFNELGTTWHSIDALPNGWEDLPQTKTWREKVLRHLKKVFYKASHPMIKDPRFCILMQGLAPWLESDLIELCFLLPVRHPFEVARSLEIAQHISMANGIRLWLNHVFSSERVSRGYPRLIVRFDKILSNPQEVLECCKTVLKSANIDFRLDDSPIIDKSLRHQHIESVRTDVERTTVMIETEREIASKLFDLLAYSDKANPLDLTVVDDLYGLWQTLG
jgi:hypothetical protein